MRWFCGQRGRKRGHVLLHQCNKFFSLFFCSTLFHHHHRPAISNLQCAWEHERVCLMCVLEVRFGARAIKALLKHFWCCWLKPKLEEIEKRGRGSEKVGVGVHALSGYLSCPSSPLAACQYYEHRGARWVNNLILTSNFHGQRRGRAGCSRDVCC